MNDRIIDVKEIENYPVKVEIPVAWGEMDAFGHVNNTYFFRYFETARIRYFNSLGLVELKEKTGIGPILAETRCRFIKPLFFPDNLTTGVRVKSMGTTSFVMEYLIISGNAGVAATGSSVIVMINYHTSGKAEIPQDVRDSINALEKGKPA